MKDRINELKKLFQDDPKDTFLQYALGLEFIKSGDPELAIERFEILLKNHPDYLPVYYHAAQLYMEIDNDQQAVNTYKKGITLASQLEDDKARQELTNAYDNLLYDSE